MCGCKNEPEIVILYLVIISRHFLAEKDVCHKFKKWLYMQDEARNGRNDNY